MDCVPAAAEAVRGRVLRKAAAAAAAAARRPADRVRGLRTTMVAIRQSSCFF
jgi:hypothetical protein